jgi:hypothetical protein
LLSDHSNIKTSSIVFFISVPSGIVSIGNMCSNKHLYKPEEKKKTRLCGWILLPKEIKTKTGKKRKYNIF